MSKKKRESLFKIGRNLIVIKKDREHDLELGQTVKLLRFSPQFNDYKVEVTYAGSGEKYPQWVSGEYLADPLELSEMKVEFEIV